MWPTTPSVSASYAGHQDPNNPDYWSSAAYMWSQGGTPYTAVSTDTYAAQDNGQSGAQWSTGYGADNSTSYGSQSYAGYTESQGSFYNSQSYDSSQSSNWQGDSFNKKTNGQGPQKNYSGYQDKTKTTSAPSVNYKNMTYCGLENSVKCRECSAMCDKDSFIQHVTDVHDALICCKFCSWRPTVRTTHVSFKDFMLKHYKYKHNIDKEEVAQTHLDTQFDELVARLEGEELKPSPVKKTVTPVRQMNKNPGPNKKASKVPSAPPVDGKRKCVFCETLLVKNNVVGHIFKQHMEEDYREIKEYIDGLQLKDLNYKGKLLESFEKSQQANEAKITDIQKCKFCDCMIMGPSKLIGHMERKHRDEGMNNIKEFIQTLPTMYTSQMEELQKALIKPPEENILSPIPVALATHSNTPAPPRNDSMATVSMDENQIEKVQKALQDIEKKGGFKSQGSMGSKSKGKGDEFNANDKRKAEPGPISQNKLPRNETLDNRLSKMNESQFKREYIANVHANHLRDIGGVNMKPEDRKIGLKRNAILDQEYYMELNAKMHNQKFMHMLEERKYLPSFNMRKDIIDTVLNNQVVVISGETGCGKTTQVAQFLLEDAISRYDGSVCNIVCTQPRRISAITVANRVAEERAERPGHSVGYQIRLEKEIPRTTGSILYCTTGIILQRLNTDPTLSTVSHLILDEIHERGMLEDFLICVSKDVLKLRPDLKLILMSATLNAEFFSQYYGGAPTLHIPGFTYPVKEYYLEDIVEKTRFQFNARNAPRWQQKSIKKKEEQFNSMIKPYARELQNDGRYSQTTINEIRQPISEEINHDFIVELLRHIDYEPEGAVLIFLPGWTEISDLNRRIQSDDELGSNRFLVIPLHSMMPTYNQKQIFETPPHGVRKIILATNIAETSITINDVVYVIDCGKMKVKNFDKEENVTTLYPEWISVANSRQRRGRAGRVANGICFHMYTRAREQTFAEYPKPEMLRVRLEEIMLHIKILKLGKVKPLLGRVMEPPDEKIVELSLQLLRNISALDDNENLTPLGFHLAQLPLDPLTGRMLIMAAVFSCVGPILTVAATNSFKDAFVVPMGEEKTVQELKRKMSSGTLSDHLMFVNVYNAWEEAAKRNKENAFAWKNFLSNTVLTQLRGHRQQFLGFLYEKKFVDSLDPESPDLNVNSNNMAVVRAVLTAGLYPNVCCVKSLGRKRRARLLVSPNDRCLSLHPKGVNETVPMHFFDNLWLMYREKVKSNKIFIYDSSVVPQYPLLFFGQNFEYDEKAAYINVDDFVKMQCKSKVVADLIQKLRSSLDELLELKISHPGVTKWRQNPSAEYTLLKVIADLLSSEAINAPPSVTEEATPMPAIGPVAPKTGAAAKPNPGGKPAPGGGPKGAAPKGGAPKKGAPPKKKNKKGGR